MDQGKTGGIQAGDFRGKVEEVTCPLLDYLRATGPKVGFFHPY